MVVQTTTDKLSLLIECLEFLLPFVSICNKLVIFFLQNVPGHFFLDRRVDIFLCLLNLPWYSESLLAGVSISLKVVQPNLPLEFWTCTGWSNNGSYYPYGTCKHNYTFFLIFTVVVGKFYTFFLQMNQVLSDEPPGYI